MKSFRLLLFLSLIPLLLGGCAGYRVGSRTLYNDRIKTVYVPMFESDSYRRNIAERLTEAVCKRITERTPYLVVSSPNADSVLSGRLISESQHVSQKNEYDDVRQKQVANTVEIVWVDRRGIPLQRSDAVPWGVNSSLLSSSTKFVPEMGNSTILAQQQAIDNMADQIVEMMQEPW